MILNMDCLTGMGLFPDASFDAIVCDPPYELGFMGKGWDSTGIAYRVDLWREALRVLKPGGHLLAFSGSRTYHRMVCAIDDAGFEIRDQIMWVYGSGMNKTGYLHAAQGAWPGVGGSLKPAHEPIVMARKRFTGSLVAHVAAGNPGGLNVDGCRVGDEVAGWGGGAAGGNTWTGENCGLAKPGEARPVTGRWPANLIHDGSDAVVALFPDSNGSGGSLPNVKITGYGDGVVGTGRSEYTPGERTPHDAGSGSAARFFYCAKASKRDRDEGLEAFAIQAAGEPSGRNDGSLGSVTLRANIHPTVKPTALMRYLVRLVTPPGGTVLDPFAGSGSTGKAAIMEGMLFTGFEMEPEYAVIAQARIDAARIDAAVNMPHDAA